MRLRFRRPVSLVTVADGMRLRQVFDNLISNAITYAPTGGQVDITLAEDDSQVVLTVADDGDGIEDADVHDVFARFYRGQNARRLGVPGTGLGLTIVQTIVEAHGGEVSLESAVGAGTTVRVVLPR